MQSASPQDNSGIAALLVRGGGSQRLHGSDARQQDVSDRNADGRNEADAVSIQFPTGSTGIIRAAGWFIVWASGKTRNCATQNLDAKRGLCDDCF